MRKRRILKCILWIIIAAVALKEASGYGYTRLGLELEQRIKEAAFRLGPLRIKTVLYLREFGYDNNVFRTPSNPVKDFTLTAGPGFQIYLPVSKKIVFSIYESPQYVYFRETKRERTWNNYFNGQAHFAFNRFFFTLGKGYSVAREIWNSEIDIRPQRKEDSYQGSAMWQPSKKTSFLFRYSQAKYDYEDLAFERTSIKRELNRVEKYVNATGYYRLSFRTMFFVDFTYGNFHFEDPLSLKNSKSYGLSGGFEFSPTGVVRGRINLGYKLLKPLAAGTQEYRGIFGDTNVSVRVLKPLNLRASYKRDISFSIWYNNAYFIENRAGLGASLYLFKSIRLDYDFSLGRNNYPQSSVLPEGATQKRRDRFQYHSVGIYFRIKKNIGAGVSVYQWTRDSNLSWENANKTFLGMNLTYDF
jgi:hypothetical protein